jgi:S-formylglutathione hydrolase FrmB
MNGKLQIETVSSQILKGNPLGDPHRREVPVYLPPSYGRGKARLPVLYYLPGFTGAGRTQVSWHPWKENLPERLDRLISEGKAAPCVLVIADCFTAYGGSQYVNSSATGRYEDHVISELVPFLEDKLALAPGAASRAVLGKSSGGFGALHLAMKHPDVFAHVGSHSGDMAFEVSYGVDLPKFVNALGRYGSVEKLLAAFKASTDKSSFDHPAVNILAMSSCYSPNPKSKTGFDVPCDLDTAELIPAVWKRWLAFDPALRAKELKGLSTIWFDCGRKDEFFLHLGARRLSRELKKLKIKHAYEEHERGHFDMADRYDRSLTLLSRALAAK